MKPLLGVFIVLATQLPIDLAHAAPPGCGEIPSEPTETYLARAQRARDQDDYARAADALWSAWCRSEEFVHLTGICEAHVLAKDLARAREIVRYAERRMARQSPRDREALLLCKRQMEGMSASTLYQAPAPPPADESGRVIVTVETTPPEAKVYIDGRLHGLLGTPVTLKVSRGVHEVRLEREGYRTQVQNIHFGSQQILSFTMTPGR